MTEQVRIAPRVIHGIVNGAEAWIIDWRDGTLDAPFRTREEARQWLRGRPTTTTTPSAAASEGRG